MADNQETGFSTATDSPTESRKKCAFGWYVFFGVSLIVAGAHFVGLWRGIGGFHVLDYIRGTTTTNTEFWREAIGAISIVVLVSVLIFLGGLWVVGIADRKKWGGGQQIVHETFVYVFVVFWATSLSTSIATYSGMCSAIPFVVFAIGATQTKRSGFFAITFLIHLSIYLTLSHRFNWGVRWQEWEWWPPLTTSSAENNYRATVSIAYLCVILPRMLNLLGDRIPHFITTGKVGCFEPANQAASNAEAILRGKIAKSQIGYSQHDA